MELLKKFDDSDRVFAQFWGAKEALVKFLETGLKVYFHKINIVEFKDRTYILFDDRFFPVKNFWETCYFHMHLRTSVYLNTFRSAYFHCAIFIFPSIAPENPLSELFLLKYSFR